MNGEKFSMLNYNCPVPCQAKIPLNFNPVNDCETWFSFFLLLV